LSEDHFEFGGERFAIVSQTLSLNLTYYFRKQRSHNAYPKFVPDSFIGYVRLTIQIWGKE